MIMSLMLPLQQILFCPEVDVVVQAVAVEREFKAVVVAFATDEGQYVIGAAVAFDRQQ